MRRGQRLLMALMDLKDKDTLCTLGSVQPCAAVRIEVSPTTKT